MSWYAIVRGTDSETRIYRDLDLALDAAARIPPTMWADLNYDLVPWGNSATPRIVRPYAYTDIDPESFREFCQPIEGLRI